MPLDPEIAALLGEPQPLPPITAELIPMIRMGMAATGQALPRPQGVAARDLDADGVPVRLYKPQGAGEGLPLLVFLHGGGWMLGDLQTHDAVCAHLCATTGAAILAVGYRLAPEHPFPAGLDDCGRAFGWARREAAALGCDPARVALGGESAGSNLTAAITLRLRDQGLAQPLFQLLVHPATSLDFALPSITGVEGPGLTKAYMTECRALYIGADGDYAQPGVSPYLAADHSGLAPAIVLTAELDQLRDDGEYYAAKLAAAGVETLCRRLAGLPHGFMFLPITLKAVETSYGLIAGLVRRYFRVDAQPA
jgi:acetyl esterase